MFVVQVFTRDGQSVGEYYHPGWLWAVATMDLDNDGYDEIILGGVNNAYGNLAGFHYPLTLVVLDSRRVEGEGPAPATDDRHFCGLSSGMEKAVLLLKEFGQLPTDGPGDFCLFREIVAGRDHFEAFANQIGRIDFGVDYQFDSHLRLEAAVPKWPVAEIIKSRIAKPLTQIELNRFYMKELGDIRVLKNDFVSQP